MYTFSLILCILSNLYGYISPFTMYCLRNFFLFTCKAGSQGSQGSKGSPEFQGSRGICSCLLVKQGVRGVKGVRGALNFKGVGGV